MRLFHVFCLSLILFFASCNSSKNISYSGSSAKMSCISVLNGHHFETEYADPYLKLCCNGIGGKANKYIGENESLKKRIMSPSKFLKTAHLISGLREKVAYTQKAPLRVAIAHQNSAGVHHQMENSALAIAGLVFLLLGILCFFLNTIPGLEIIFLDTGYLFVVAGILFIIFGLRR